jgi:competence protein ComEC
VPYLSLAFAVALTAGVAAGIWSSPEPSPLGAIAVTAAWIAAAVAYRAGWTHVQLSAIALLVAAGGWTLGAHAVERALHPALRTLLEQRVGGFAIETHAAGRVKDPILLEGRLWQDAVLTDSGATLRLDVARVWIGSTPETTSGGVSISVGGGMQGDYVRQWTAGRTIRVPAVIRRPARYLNHGVPDQERSFARRGVTLVGSVKSAALVEVVAPGGWWDERAAGVRRRTRMALEQHVGPRAPGSAAIAAAILIGDRAGLDHAVQRQLQEAGTYHVIAISGGNIAILAGLMLGVLRWLRLRGRLAAIATIAGLAAYSAVTAGGPSVARATLMAIVYLAVRLLDHRTAAANTIGLTAALVVLANPLAVTDAGFWLTFGATGAILVAASQIALPAAVSVRVIGGVLLATLAAELALAPVAALVFQRVTLAGLALNFAALPAMTLVQIAALVVVACDAIGLAPVAHLAGILVHAGSGVLTGSARLVDFMPWVTWRVPSPAAAVVASYYAALALAVLSFRLTWASQRSRQLACAIAAALFLWIVAAPQTRARAAGDGRLHVSMFDVGQGDAMLVTFPNGRRLVVDAGGVSPGGAFDIGDRVVGPSLRARGIVDLDYLAVTHGDLDHAGGAVSLVRDFGPREVWWGVPVANDEPTAAIQREVVRARASWRTLQRGDRLQVGDVEVRVLHPPLPDWERQKIRNDDSVVLELRYGRVSALLTGDIGREVEQQLLPSLDLHPTVILKIAHHGSGTSSSAAFVNGVRPAVALIGVGRGNVFAHPVPVVLDRLRRAGAEVFRTDLDGQIDVVTDGGEVVVATWTGRRVIIPAARPDPPNLPAPSVPARAAPSPRATGPGVTATATRRPAPSPGTAAGTSRSPRGARPPARCPSSWPHSRSRRAGLPSLPRRAGRFAGGARPSRAAPRPLRPPSRARRRRSANRTRRRPRVR